MPAPKGNQFALKTEGETATSHLHIRVTPSEKSDWVRAAQARAKREGKSAEGAKLAAWVSDTLNAAAAAELHAAGEKTSRDT